MILFRRALPTLTGLLILCCTSAPTATQPSPSPAPSAAAPAAPAAPATSALQAGNDHEVDEVMETIAGRENEPAEKVFKNIQVMKGVPAARLLRIMNAGYSKALGVSCEHCHVHDQWEVDEKRPKRAARDMILMASAINDQHLKAMKHLDGEATVNCNTCHRGEVKPAKSAR